METFIRQKEKKYLAIFEFLSYVKTNLGKI